MKFINMRTENLVSPMGIDCAVPRLSWKLTDCAEGFSQAASRVIVCSSEAFAKACNGDVFDSGEYANGFFFQLCSGIKLESSSLYFWRVQVRDANGAWSEFSPVATFETGLMDSSMWQGSFIGTPCSSSGDYLFRRHFDCVQKPVRVRIYAAAAGFIELYVNGKRVGTNVLEPVNSDYNKFLYYVTYDCTERFTVGDNAVGVRLNNGWLDGDGKLQACFILQGLVTYADGTEQVFTSNANDWLFVYGQDSVATQYSGEVRRNTMTKPEWCLPGDAFEKKYPYEWVGLLSGWVPSCGKAMADWQEAFINCSHRAMEMPAPAGRIMATAQEPVVIGEELKPRTITKIKDGWLYDFGQNFTGVTRFTVKGERDTCVSIVHTELLNDDGTPNTVYLRIAEPNYPFEMQTDKYYLQGTGEPEVLTPSFTYHGFRFVAVYGVENATLDMLTANTLASDVKQIGSFETGHDMISWIQSAAMWTEKGNLHSIPTDCPQRAERQGWLNDMTARSEGAVYNLDLQLLYSKWTRDIRGTQDPISGAIGDTAPYRRGNKPADAVCSSYLLAPYYVYTHFGDDRALRENYDGIKAWADYLYRNSDDGIARYSLYGDWAGPEPDGVNGSSAVSAVTPGWFMSSGFNCFNAELMAEIAAALGKEDDRLLYEARHQHCADRINEVFFDSKTANYCTGSQGANTFALKLGIVPKEYCQKVADNINADIIKRDYHLSTGNICTKYLPEVLSDYGYIETAMKLMEQTTYPSWGYMRSKGATTIWERWEYATGFAMNSHSHPMYGSVMAWFYKYLGGINVLEKAFKRFEIKPFIPESVPFVKASVDTPFGIVCSEWHKTDSGVVLTVTVPPCTEAVVVLPAKNADGSRTVTVHAGTHTFNF